MSEEFSVEINAPQEFLVEITQNSQAFNATGFSSSGVSESYVANAISTHSNLTSGAHGITNFGASVISSSDASGLRTVAGLGNVATLNYSGDETKFLRDDGTFAAPPAGGVVNWGDLGGNIENQSDLQSSLSGKLSISGTAVDSNLLSGQESSFYRNYNNLTGVPSEFNPSSHNHSASDITGGQFDTGRISEQSVTQYSGSLSIQESQISDLGSYITGVSWGEIQGSVESQSDLSGSLAAKLGTGQTAADSNKLNGESADYYRNYDNLTGVPSEFNPSSHSHTLSDISDAGSAASQESGLFLNRSNHTGLQEISTISGLQNSLDSKLPATGVAADSNLFAGQNTGYFLDYTNISGTPSLGSAAASDTGDFAQASHVHVVSEITNFESGVSNNATVTGKLDKTGVAADSLLLSGQNSSYYRNYSNITGTPILGSAAASDVEDFAQASHTHNTGDISGLGNVSALNYTGDTSKFLRGDGTFAAPPSGGAVSWGDIGGDISNQSDLSSSLGGKLDTTGIAANSTLFGGENSGYYRNYDNLTGLPTGFTPSSHIHTTGEISGLGSSASLESGVLLDRSNHTGSQGIDSIANLQTSLDAKLSTTGVAADSTLFSGQSSDYYRNYQNLTGTPTLGTMAAEDTGNYAQVSHGHNVSDITDFQSGVSNNSTVTGKLDATGTAQNSTLLNGQSGEYYTNYNNLSNVPTGFTPEYHTHTTGEISGLGTLISDHSNQTSGVHGITAVGSSLTTQTTPVAERFIKVKSDGTTEQRSINQTRDDLELSLSKIGTPTYSSLQHLMNFVASAGQTSGGAIVDAGSQTINVGAGTGFIKATDSDVAELFFFDWAASNGISIPLNSKRFVGVEYNSGTPQVVVKTTNDFDLDTSFPLAEVINEEGVLHILNNPWWVGDGITNIIERFQADGTIFRDKRIGGLILGITGTRNVTLTGGTLWSRLNEYLIASIDTSGSDSFTTEYRNGSGGWTMTSGVTQFPNTLYDDGSGTLVEMTNNRYANLWFYIETDGGFVMLYPQSEHTTFSSAELEQPPTSIPDRVIETGLLVGRIIFQKGAATGNAESAFDTIFSPALVTSHNDLSDLQGGEIGGYYHLTATELTDVGTIPTLTSHTTNTSNPHGVTKSQVGLGNVENTTLSTWVGSSNLTNLGTISIGTWQGTAIADAYISSAATWNSKAAGTVIPDYITTGALTSSASISWDVASLGVVRTLTLGEHATLTLSNLADGQSASLGGVMGGSGSHTLTLAHSGLTVREMSGALADIASLAVNDLFELAIRRVGSDLRVWITTKSLA